MTRGGWNQILQGNFNRILKKENNRNEVLIEEGITELLSYYQTSPRTCWGLDFGGEGSLIKDLRHVSEKQSE